MSVATQIPVKSPVALIGVFLAVIRERFSESHNLPWVYTPGDAERSDNSITIEAGTNPLTEERNKRPAIYVVRNAVAYKQATIGDKQMVQKKSGGVVYYATAETSFTFIAESDSEGEAAQIADVVLSTLMMGSDIIEHAFRFRKLGPFALSAAMRPVHEEPVAQIHISMGLTFDVRWATIPISPMLNEIVVKSTNSTYNSSEEYFSEIYQKSFRHRN